MLKVIGFEVEVLRMMVFLVKRKLVKEKGAGFGVLLAKNEVLGIRAMWILAINDGGNWGGEGLERERARRVKLVFLARKHFQYVEDGRWRLQRVRGSVNG